MDPALPEREAVDVAHCAAAFEAVDEDVPALQPGRWADNNPIKGEPSKPSSAP